MRASDDKALQYAIAEITEIATGFGLDFIRCVMKYVQRKLFIHLVHGMPTRFSHWSFGKQFSE